METTVQDSMTKKKYDALGIHVFAGGFSGGVAEEANVLCQLECHGFGLETASKTWGVQTVNCDPHEWPKIKADWVFSNPRCTGFSCVTAGYGEDCHGPFAKQCQDIRDLIDYAKDGDYPVIVWESVQQAYSTGRPLLDLLRDELVAKGYRIVHLLMNGHTFGNAQCRRRYFFVAHKRELRFNVQVPDVSPYYPTAYDAIWHLRDRETSEYKPNSTEYTFDSYVQLLEYEKHEVPRLATGWSMNQLAPYDFDNCHEKTKRIWRERTSRMPFSMHGCFRLSWFRPCPTLTSTAGRYIHPWLNRPLTVGELATLMGWNGKIPVGKLPIAQIAKGVIPSAAKWLAQQVHFCLDDAWGGEDFEVAYDHHKGEFVGRDSHDLDEKTIDLTHYHGKMFDIERFDVESRSQFHRFNVDLKTGRLLRKWDEIDATPHLQR